MSAAYAKLLVYRNGGAAEDGGISAAYSDVIRVRGESTVGWYAQRWEIFDYPPAGFSTPAGWTLDPDTLVMYSTAVEPPDFTLPVNTYWGKWMLRLKVNQATTDDSASLTLTDESTALEILSSNSLHDVASGESNQFNNDWNYDLKVDLRLLDDAIGGMGGGGPPTGAAGGDLSGNYPNPNVAKVRGVAIGTAAPGMVVGRVLRATGASTADWGAVDLADTDAVTGLLPVTNIAPSVTNGFVLTTVGGVTAWAAATSAVTLAGDVTGPSGANTVVGLTGTFGVVAMHGNDVTWDEASTPALKQTTRSTDAATHNFTITGQAPNAGATGTNRNSGGVLFESPAPTAGGTQGRVAMRIAGSEVIAATAVGMLMLFGAPTWSTGAAVPSSSEVDGSLYTRTGSPNGGLWSRENGAWVKLGTGTGAVTLAGDVTGPSGSNTVVGLTGTTNVVAMHGNAITWDEATTPLLNQTTRSTDAATHDFSIIAQAPNGSATGSNRNSGALLFESPAPASGGTQGRVAIRLAATDVLAATALDKVVLFNLPTLTTGSAVPSASEVDGSLYMRTGSPNGNLYLRQNATWVSLVSTGSVTLAGDATGPSGANTVERINGATVPVAGGLTPGHVLQVSGVAALTYALLPPTSLAVGAANTVLWSNGSANSFTGSPILATSLDVPFVSLNTGTRASTGALRLPTGALSIMAARNAGNSADIDLMSMGTSTLGRVNSLILGGAWSGVAAPGGDVEVKTRGQYIHSNQSDIVSVFGAGNRGPGDGSTFYTLRLYDLGGAGPRKSSFVITNTSAGSNGVSFFTGQTDSILSLNSYFDFDSGGLGAGGWLAGSTVASSVRTGASGFQIYADGSLVAGNVFTPTVRVTLSTAGALRLHNYGAGVLQTDASGNVTAGAGSITLAGDVTGPNSSNIVVGLTGIAGFVAVHGNALRWDALASGFRLTQADQTTNAPVMDFQVITSAPFASATGANRNAANGLFRHRPPVSSGVAGRWAFEVSDAEKFAVELDRLLVTVPTVAFAVTTVLQPVTAGGSGIALRVSGGDGGTSGGALTLTGGTGPTSGVVQVKANNLSGGMQFTTTNISMGIDTLQFEASLGDVEFLQVGGSGVRPNLIVSASASSDNLGGSLQLRGGTGGSSGQEGDVALLCGNRTVIAGIHSSPNPILTIFVPSARWSDEVLAPILFQAQQPNDSVVPQVLTFRSQDPYSGASGLRRIAGNMSFQVGESVNGADQIAHFEWRVANQLKTEFWIDRVEFYDQGLHFNPDLSAAGISMSDAVGAVGHSFTITAGQGDTGFRGGDIIIRGGVPGAGFDGGGLIVHTGNDLRAMFQSVQLDSGFITAIGYQSVLTASDVPLVSNVILLADAYSLSDVIDLVGPTNAILIASNSGMPLFQCANGSFIRFDGQFHSGPVGASAGFYDIQINGIDLCLEAFNRS